MGVRDVAGPGTLRSSAPSAPKGPGRRRGPDKPPKKPEPTVPYREGVVKKGLTKFYMFLALILLLVDQDVAKVIAGNAEALAESWEIVARQNPRVRRILYGLISTSSWGLVLTAHLPLIVIAIRKWGPAGARQIMQLIINFTDGDILVSQQPGEAVFNLADFMAEGSDTEEEPSSPPAQDQAPAEPEPEAAPDPTGMFGPATLAL